MFCPSNFENKKKWASIFLLHAALQIWAEHAAYLRMGANCSLEHAISCRPWPHVACNQPSVNTLAAPPCTVPHVALPGGPEPRRPYSLPLSPLATTSPCRPARCLLLFIIILSLKFSNNLPLYFIIENFDDNLLLFYHQINLLCRFLSSKILVANLRDKELFITKNKNENFDDKKVFSCLYDYFRFLLTQ